MKYFLPLLVLVLIVNSCNKPGNPPITPTVNEWQGLIDNELSHWTLPDNTTYSLEDQILYLEANSDGRDNWLFTEEEYSNFEFETEFLLGTDPGSILVRHHDRPSAAVQESGYVVSLDFDPNQENPIGTILGTARSTIPEGINAEDWNKIAVLANGDHLKVMLNGKVVAEGHDRKRIRGTLGIQVPGRQAAFRNMRVKILPELEITEPLLEDRYRNDAAVNWEPMFQADSLNGWNHTGDGKWEINDGIVHGYSGEKGGFLVSEKAYKNFYLKCEFKIIKEDNSGIFIRKTPDSTSVTTTDAIECNIYDHNGPAHAYSTGSIATHARAWYGMIDYDDWNTMEIFAHEEHIVMFVNDQKSSDAHLPPQFNKAGNICLQGGIKVFSKDQGPSDIYFRNMMIKNMDSI